MSHWETLFKNSRSRALKCLEETIQHGQIVPVSETRRLHRESHPNEPAFFAYAYPATPVRFLTICQTNPGEEALEAVNGFPYLAVGESNVLEVLTLNPDDIGSEGTVECVSKTSEGITFFDPLFCYNKDEYVIGRKYEFSLAAIAYNIEWLQHPEFEISSGPALEAERERVRKEDPAADVSTITSVSFSMEKMKCLIPHDAPGDVEFQSSVESVEWFQILDIRICNLRCVFREDDNQSIPASLFVSEHVLNGYEPQVGHIVRGVAWLQAFPIKEIESDECWSDRGSEREALLDGWERAFEAAEYLADLHPGAAALGRVLISAGWDVTIYSNPGNDPEVPAFLAERGDRQVNVWIRAYFPETEQPIDLPFEKQTALKEHSETQGQEAAFVTVECKEVDNYHYFNFVDHQNLQSIFGNLALVEAIRKPGTESIDSE
jgi:hypothetical protein